MPETGEWWGGNQAFVTPRLSVLLVHLFRTLPPLSFFLFNLKVVICGKDSSIAIAPDSDTAARPSKS